LAYSNQHKGYKCLEPSRVYISRDVIFEETIFPFSTLHPNAGALLNAKIILLHPTLRNFHEGERVDEPNRTNVTNSTLESFAYTGHTNAENGVQASASGIQIPASCDINQEQVNSIVAENLSTKLGGDRLPTDKDGMKNCKRVTTFYPPQRNSQLTTELDLEKCTRYQSVVRALQYLSLTRSDLSFLIPCVRLSPTGRMHIHICSTVLQPTTCFVCAHLADPITLKSGTMIMTRTEEGE
jgi:hypothetical protein